MQVTFDEMGTVAVCHLVGSLESATVGEFREALGQLNLGRPVIFVLESVPFVDSAGIGALIGAVRRIRELNGDAAVCSARPSVGRVLKMVGLSRIINVFDTLGEAADHFSGWTAA